MTGKEGKGGKDRKERQGVILSEAKDLAGRRSELNQ
jgi:hypothetical protein